MIHPDPGLSWFRMASFTGGGNTMRYEDFKEVFTKEITFLMEGSGVQISSQQIQKVNETLDALSFRRQGDNIGTLLYLKDIYEQHEQGVGIVELAEQARQFIGV